MREKRKRRKEAEADRDKAEERHAKGDTVHIRTEN